MPHRVFVSHAWRPDEQGRSTHARAAVAAALRATGWSVWFDADDLVTEDLDVAMTRGIEAAGAVLVCIARLRGRGAPRRRPAGARQLRPGVAVRRRQREDPHPGHLRGVDAGPAGGLARRPCPPGPRAARGRVGRRGLARVAGPSRR